MKTFLHPDIEQALDDKQIEKTLEFMKVITAVDELKSDQIFFNPNPRTNVELYNNQVDLIWCSNKEKIIQLHYGLKYSLANKNYILYGLIGRALIEHAAVLRYFVVEKIQPAFVKIKERKKITRSDFEKLMGEVHKLLRGTRFDWEAFETKNFEKLKNEKHETRLQSVHVNDSLRSWQKEFTSVHWIYNWFCDFVHPNLGSTLLLQKRFPHTRQIAFGGSEGEEFGIKLIKMTWVGIIQVAIAFGYYQNRLSELRMTDDTVIEQ